MAHSSVVEPITARLKTGFNRCPIYVENEVSSVPENAGPWILLDFPWSRSEWVGPDEFMEEGGFRVMLAMEPEEETKVGRGWLEEVAALFRGQDFDGIQCFAPQSPSTDDSNEASGYFRLVITVPYRTLIVG